MTHTTNKEIQLPSNDSTLTVTPSLNEVDCSSWNNSCFRHVIIRHATHSDSLDFPESYSFAPLTSITTLNIFSWKNKYGTPQPNLQLCYIYEKPQQKSLWSSFKYPKSIRRPCHF